MEALIEIGNHSSHVFACRIFTASQLTGPSLNQASLDVVCKIVQTYRLALGISILRGAPGTQTTRGASWTMNILAPF